MASRVRLVNWNPRTRASPALLGRRLRWGARVNNFGDVLSEWVVEGMLRTRGLSLASTARSRSRLLAVGSVIHFAHNSDTVWGSGINGKMGLPRSIDNLDVRAIRGPRTRAVLSDRGISAPGVFGDPVLLLPQLYPRVSIWSREPKKHTYAVVPNLHDFESVSDEPGVVDPRSDVWSVVEQICRSERVVGSSLHGIIVAETVGIPAVLIRPEREDLFKYHDYYEGTGRTSFPIASSVAEALEVTPSPPPSADLDELKASFPWDLWDVAK